MHFRRKIVSLQKVQLKIMISQPSQCDFEFANAFHSGTSISFIFLTIQKRDDRNLLFHQLQLHEIASGSRLRGCTKLWAEQSGEKSRGEREKDREKGKQIGRKEEK